MGVDDFHLEFENPSLNFFPGQPINGKVVIICDSSTDTNGVVITFHGKESVYWTETYTETVYTGYGADRKSETVYRTRTYSGSATLVDKGFYVIGSENLKVTLPEGRTEYTFQFILPRPLPSTFHGEHGYVSYDMKAEILRPWYKANDKCDVGFTVTAFVDLNSVPQAAQPASTSNSKTVCCLCCESGPISFTLNIPRQGYVPGELIPFEAALQNMSNNQVLEASVTFYQQIDYHADGGYNYEKYYLESKKRQGLEPGQSDVWTGDVIRAPDLYATNLGGGCPHIKLNYGLQLDMEISGPTSNLRGTVPIFLGNIRFRKPQEEAPRNDSLLGPPPPLPQDENLRRRSTSKKELSKLPGKKPKKRKKTQKS